MNKYELRTQQKKTAIVNAALTSFNKNGFLNSSIKEIAALAQVSQVSIYNYYGSKDALVAECAKIIMSNTVTNARELLSKDMDFKEKLIQALELCTQQINISLGEYLSSTALSDCAFVKRMENSVNELKKELYREFIEAGKKENAINSDLSTDIILKFIESLNTIEMDTDNLLKEQHQIHQLFLFGLLGR